MATFDENGKYIKTNWKAGDKITATKLNKIEESIEAVNDNDISRHVEADARLDALEAKDVAHDKELTNVKNLIADNKAAAELGDYEINSRMTFLEEELNEGIEEVHNVASTVDGKIAQAVTNVNNVASTVDGKIAQAVTNVNNVASTVDGKIAQGKADMEAMVAEVEADLEGLHAKDVELSEQVAHIENDILKRVVIPALKTESEDSEYDNLKAINIAIEKIKSTGGIINIPNGIYLIDSDYFVDNKGIVLYSNITIEGNGSTFLLKNKEYSNNISIIQTYNMIDGGYSDDIDCVENIEIRNLKIDGNTLNMNNEKSITGIAIYKGKNIKINNTSIKNLSGKNGEGYGFIPWYCDNVEVKNVEIVNVDRSPIYVWETSNFVMDSCHLENGYFRDAITISTNSPYSHQRTTFNIKNSKFINKNTTGTHVVRFSGTCDGVFENNIIEGDNNFDGICIIDTYYKNLVIKNNKVYNCTEGITISSDTDKNITFENNLISDCIKGVYCVSSRGDVKFFNNKIVNSTDRSVEIGYADSVIFNNNYIEGGHDVAVSHFKHAVINNNILKNVNENSDKSNVFLINGSDGEVQFNFNIFDNSPGNVRIYTKGKAICNGAPIDSSTLTQNQFNG